MSVKYSRYLQAAQTQAKKNGVTKDASDALDEVLKLPHPNRELAFLDWVLSTDLYKNPTAAHEKLTHDQLSI